MAANSMKMDLLLGRVSQMRESFLSMKPKADSQVSISLGENFNKLLSEVRELLPEEHHDSLPNRIETVMCRFHKFGKTDVVTADLVVYLDQLIAIVEVLAKHNA